MDSKASKGFGPLLLMAGGEHGVKGKGDPNLAFFIKAAGLKNPRVAYIGAASDDDPYYYSITEPVILSSGAGEVFLARFDGHVGFRSLLQSADLAFISGGDVESGMANLEKANALAPMAELYKRGMPFAGVSAGSIMMGKAWAHWSDPADDASASLFPCLGFTEFLCDAHDEFDGWGELKTALSLCPEGTHGYGLPTGAALYVPSDGQPRALRAPLAAFSAKGGSAASLESLKP